MLAASLEHLENLGEHDDNHIINSNVVVVAAEGARLGEPFGLQSVSALHLYPL